MSLSLSLSLFRIARMFLTRKVDEEGRKIESLYRTPLRGYELSDDHYVCIYSGTRVLGVSHEDKLFVGHSMHKTGNVSQVSIRKSNRRLLVHKIGYVSQVSIR